jgi:sugar phosphate isomerase/epimerase
MTVFLSTTFAPLHTPVTNILSDLRQRGITTVELGSTHCHEPDIVSKLRELDMDYLVHNYFPPPIEPFVVNIASRDSDIRKRSLNHAKRSLSFCAEIGAHLYTFHPGFVSDPTGESASTSNYDFQFASHSTDAAEYSESFVWFMEGTRILVEHARREGVALAVESQGSVAQSGHLLLQRPEEFECFTATFPKEDIGLSVNIGHLNLASRFHDFDPIGFIDRFAERIIALEISHNDGYKDDHAALERDAWYWPVITDERLAGDYKIFEGRNLSIDTAVQMVDWLREAVGERPGGE